MKVFSVGYVAHNQAARADGEPPLSRHSVGRQTQVNYMATRAARFSLVEVLPVVASTIRALTRDGNFVTHKGNRRRINEARGVERLVGPPRSYRSCAEVSRMVGQ